VSEACDLRWDDIDLPKRTIIVRRLKGSTDSVHYLERDEVNGCPSSNALGQSAVFGTEAVARLG
jgi:integrase